MHTVYNTTASLWAQKLTTIQCY